MAFTPVDPATAVWGFHVHQDLTSDTTHELSHSLASQAAAASFLHRHGIVRDVIAAFRPGYGPHWSNAWEIRVESSPKQFTLTYYGVAIVWHAFNHHGIGSYIHPTMHDETAPGLVQLHDEGVHHTNHTLFFGPKRVDLNLDFFFHPPLTAEGRIADTRNPHHIKDDEVNALVAQWQEQQQSTSSPGYVDPFVANRVKAVVIQVEDTTGAHSGAVATLIEALLSALGQRGIVPAATRTYSATSDSEWASSPSAKSGLALTFEVVESIDEGGAVVAPAVDGLTAGQRRVARAVGTTVAWLFCNRLALAEHVGLPDTSYVSVFGRVVTSDDTAPGSVDRSFYLGINGVLKAA